MNVCMHVNVCMFLFLLLLLLLFLLLPIRTRPMSVPSRQPTGLGKRRRVVHWTAEETNALVEGTRLHGRARTAIAARHYLQTATRCCAKARGRLAAPLRCAVVDLPAEFAASAPVIILLLLHFSPVAVVGRARVRERERASERERERVEGGVA